jgi:excinuclease UvrABC nuclease subunit
MPITTPFHRMDAAHINQVPNSRGVYQLEIGSEIIYIGKGAGIRQRLQSHHRGTEGQCTQVAEWFRYEITTSAEIRERDLLKEYVDANGRPPCCNEVVR